MSVIATALKHMMDAGMDREAILAAVADMEADMKALVANDQPSKGALRQRRYQERKRQKSSESVTSDDNDAETSENDARVSLDKRPLNPKINPIPCEGEKRARATRIREGWAPTRPVPPTVADLCAQWPPGRLERELEGFVAYWLARNRDAARTDWDLVWHNRIRDQHDRIMRESRNGRQLQTDRSSADSLRGSRPDPSLDMWRQADAEIAAASQYPEIGGGAWVSLPSERTG